MCSVGSVAQQHDVFMVPVLVGDAPKAEPRHPTKMGHLIYQRIAIKVRLEDLLQERDALIWPELVEAEPHPGLLWALDDASAGVSVEAVGVEPNPASIRLLKGEGEGVEHLVGAEPDVLVPTNLDVRLELVGVELAEPTISAVAGDDQLSGGQLREIFNLALELNVSAEIHCALSQNAEQTLATHT